MNTLKLILTRAMLFVALTLITLFGIFVILVIGILSFIAYPILVIINGIINTNNPLYFIWGPSAIFFRETFELYRRVVTGEQI